MRSLHAVGSGLGIVLLTGWIAACDNPASATVREPPPSPPVAFLPPLEAELQPDPVRDVPLLPGMLDVAALADRVRPVVVNISASKHSDPSLPKISDLLDPELPFDGGGPKERALGSGFIVSSDGLVVTNDHVVEGADDIRVRLDDDREFDARVIGHDAKLDVALLQLEGARGLPVASLGASEGLRIGEYTVAIGNPYGLGHSVTLGIVSAKARAMGVGPYDHFIQTDAAINPGSSGGPLFDTRGRVIGVNTAVHARGRGIGFAIPIDDVRAVLPELRSKGHVTRGRLGVTFQEMTADLARALRLERERGALVSDVEPKSPAARVGLRPGDVIVSIDKSPIQRAPDLARALGKRKPGERVEIEYLRRGERRQATAVLATSPLELTKRVRETLPPPPPGLGGPLGVRASDAPGGARIDAVMPRAPAAGEIEVGDVVVEVNGVSVRSAEELSGVLGAARARSVLLVRLLRDGDPRYVAVRMP